MMPWPASAVARAAFPRSAVGVGNIPEAMGVWTSLELDGSGQFITTSAEVTPNGGLVRESPQNGLKLG